MSAGRSSNSISIGEDDADGGLAFLGFAFDADYVAAQLHALNAVHAGRLHGYLQLRLQTRAVLQGDKRALQGYISHQRVFLKWVATFGYTTDVSAEMRLAAQGSAATGHVSFHAFAGRAQSDDHAFAGSEYGIKFVAGVLKNSIHDAISGIRVMVKEH